MEVSHIVYVRKKSTSGVGYLTPSQVLYSIQLDCCCIELFANCAEHAGDTEVMVELFELIGRLSVRDEFCQKVLELGGVSRILSALQNSISDKVFIFSFAFFCSSHL